MSIETVRTTQNVSITRTYASAGERLVAGIIDAFIVTVYLYMVFLVSSFMSIWSLFSTSPVAGVILSIIIYGPGIFYHLIFESVMNGQSPGKRMMKIKVMREDGRESSFPNYLIRWIFRVVDILLTFGAVALICVIASKKRQRIGDMIAKTTVVRLERETGFDQTIFEKAEEDYIPVYPQVLELKDKDIAYIKNVLHEANKFGHPHVKEALADKIKDILKIENEGSRPGEFLKTILKDYNHFTSRM